MSNPHDVSQVQPADHINFTFIGGNAMVHQEAHAIGVDGSVRIVNREGRAPEVEVSGNTLDAVCALNSLIATLTTVRNRLAPPVPKPEPCVGLKPGWPNLSPEMNSVLAEEGIKLVPLFETRHGVPDED